MPWAASPLSCLVVCKIEKPWAWTGCAVVCGLVGGGAWYARGLASVLVHPAAGARPTSVCFSEPSPLTTTAGNPSKRRLSHTPHTPLHPLNHRKRDPRQPATGRPAPGPFLGTSEQRQEHQAAAAVAGAAAGGRACAGGECVGLDRKRSGVGLSPCMVFKGCRHAVGACRRKRGRMGGVVVHMLLWKPRQRTLTYTHTHTTHNP